MINIISRYKSTIINLFWRTLQIVARNGFSFAIFYLASLFLPKEDFGYYNYILKMAFLVTLFVDFGISMAVSKYTAEFNIEANQKIKTLLTNSIIITLFLALVASIIIGLLNIFWLKAAQSHIIHLIPLFFLVPLTSLFDAVFRGLKRFRELSLITFFTGLISLLAFYFLISIYGLLGAFYAQNIFYLSMLLGLWGYFKTGPFVFDRKLFNDTYKYGLTIGVIGVFMFLSTQVDVLFLGYFNYYTEVAYYEIIFRFLTFLMMPFAILGHVLAPDFTKNFIGKQYQWVKIKLKKSIIFSLIISILVCLILYVTLPFIFERFFSKYNSVELQKMSNIMLILFFSSMLNGFIPLIAIATGHARWGMYFIVGVGILNVFFDYFSIIHWGIWGLIYSTVIIKSVANVSFIAYYYFKLPDKT